MRVQPHLPSRPFTATVIVSSGAAWCACSAANRPAPPAPRTRMAVRIRFTAGRRRGRASGLHAEAGQHLGTPRLRVVGDDAVEAVAMAVHGDEGRGGIAGGEF